ncbi:tail fiber assembly protein [Candidatus Erwinia dacicola]|uniref:Phage tail protein n=1 Tax=Candidatus Erwinia dacicola TaxID=252393 RepID=A0A1E7YZR4_9GAMM|nr:tail fiber assembly protein [Candidatus Erwinia dacicola]NJD85866.1 phage tail protein [Candidatus Erwinia dacicola]OFC61983.1 phage tail protein [Candidatus Erwinia dacicola]RAP70081.1 tail fiber assembly protein [Candidatus Erwinia dacicola]
MAFEMSDKAQTIKVFNLRADTGEFIGAGDAYIPAHTGLPANCTPVPPPAIPAGQVAIFNDKGQAWSLSEDHRGKTVYDTSSGQAVFISDIGPLPENAVTAVPAGQYEKWDGKAWVKDEEAQNNALQAEAADRQRQLITEARTIIGEWQTELMLGSISDVNKAKLQTWIDYIEALKRVELSDPAWPDTPVE